MQRGRNFSLVVLALLAIGLLAKAASAADKRVALVIGNSTYQHTSKLANPRQDAADLAATLKRLGFVVIEGIDLDKPAMDRTIRQFARELAGAQTGLFFYAGHGLQVDGQNYLVPIDAKLEDATGLDFETVRLELVHKTMERATRTNLIFLDACRDNPLARNLARALGTRSANIGKGLAAVESGEGTLISFSTQPGNVAVDGTGRNSPFAAALLTQLLQSRDDLSTMLIAVRNQVMQDTDRRQVPWEHSALTARFYFTPPEQQPSKEAGTLTMPVPSLTYEQQAEIAFWNTIKDSGNVAALQSYIDRFPQGAFVALARILIDKHRQEAEQKSAAHDTALRQEAAARNKAATAKRTEDEVRAAALKEGEERRRAEAERATAEAEAKRKDEEAKRLVEEAEAARTWAATKDTSSTAVLEAFVRKFSSTIYGDLARARLKEVRSTASKSKEKLAAVAPQGGPCGKVVGVWLGPTGTDMIFRADGNVTSPAFSDSGPWSCKNGHVVISWKQWGVDRCSLSSEGIQMSCTNSLIGSAFTRTRKSGS